MRRITTSLKGKIGEIIFDRGRKYFEKEDAVVTLVISDGEILVVEGEYREGKTKVITSISVTQKEGNYVEGHCDCLDYQNRKNICRHVVSLGMQSDIMEDVVDILGSDKIEMIFEFDEKIKFIEPKVIKKKKKIDREEKRNKSLKKEEKLIEVELKEDTFKETKIINRDEIIKKLTNKKNKKEFFIEIELDKTGYSDYRYGYDYEATNEESGFIFRLKVGTNKTYYVKDTFKFVKSVIEGENLSITSKLSYSPNDYYFSENNIEIILKMYECYEKNEGLAYIKDKKGMKVTEDIYESILDTLDFDRNITILEKSVKKESEHQPLFIKTNEGLVLRDIFQNVDSSKYFFLKENENKIYKMRENEKKLFEELNILKLDDFNSIVNKNKISELIYKYKVECAYYSDEYGKIDVYIQTIKGNKNLKIKINENREALKIDDKYYIPRPDKKMVEKFNKVLKEISIDIMKSNIETNYIIDYDKLQILSKIIEKDFSDKVKIHLDSEIRKPKNIYISFGIEKTKNDLLNFNFNIDGIEKEDFDLVLNEIKNSKKYILLSSGQLVKIANENIEEITEVINEISNFKVGNNKISKIKALQLSQISKDVRDNLLEIDEFKKIFRQIKEKKEIEPRNIKANLFSYQKLGFNWLKNMYEIGLGCVLADDMGLGKTLQTISLLSEISLENKDFFAMIIVPTSLLHNWKEEIIKFSSINPILIEGVSKKRKELIKKAKKGILITTYQSLRNDIDDYKGKKFDLVILDEAQNIKTPTSQIKKAVMKLDSEVNIALTGTPVENNILELWSIFDFVLNGYLDTLNKFKKNYKELLFDTKSKKIEKLRKIVAPFILRRVKKEVLTQLPDKFETNLVVQLSQEQKSLYMSYVKKAKKEISKFDKKENNRIKILAILTKLRQICNSPVLFKEDYTGEVAKIEVMRDLLPDIIENEHRLLIFSQFVGTLKEVEKELADNNIEYFYIDGSVPSKERVEICNRFNDGEKQVVLISLKAGGTGLNLIGADVVIHYDPWWNIAVENQASDRAYRIGQKNSVQVIKLITEGTIEEKILKIQDNKRFLSENLIEGKTGEQIFDMTDDELLELLL